MTDVNFSEDMKVGFSTDPSTFSVEDIFWGYKVRSNRGPSPAVMLAQAVSFFFGACFLTAAAGLWLMPSLIVGDEVGVMHVTASILFGAVAIYLLYFASRGTRSELHVDTSLGEIREVIANRAGRPTTVGTYGFDTIGGVFLEQPEGSDLATLILRYRNTAQTVSVAEGTEAQLIPLRDRLGHDLMVQTTSQVRTAA